MVQDGPAGASCRENPAGEGDAGAWTGVLTFISVPYLKVRTLFWEATGKGRSLAPVTDHLQKGPSMTIVITGATGQLGRLVVEALLERGVPAEEIVAAGRTVEKLADLGDARRPGPPHRLQRARVAAEGVRGRDEGAADFRQRGGPAGASSTGTRIEAAKAGRRRADRLHQHRQRGHHRHEAGRRAPGHRGASCGTPACRSSCSATAGTWRTTPASCPAAPARRRARQRRRRPGQRRRPGRLRRRPPRLCCSRRPGRQGLRAGRRRRVHPRRTGG